MDRNEEPSEHAGMSQVATREGGVDRNEVVDGMRIAQLLVATREGGVDRNGNIQHYFGGIY